MKFKFSMFFLSMLFIFQVNSINSDSLQNLKFHLKMDTDSLYPELPIYYRLELVNDSDGEIKHLITGLESPSMKILYKMVGEDEYKKFPQLHHNDYTDFFKIPANSTHYVEESILIPPFANVHRNILPPGKYLFKVNSGQMFIDDTISTCIDTNTVSLEIKQPVGVEKAAYELWKETTDKTFCKENAQLVINTLKKIITTHDGTDYAKYARYRLGAHYIREGRSQKKIDLSQRGFEYLGPLLQSDKSFTMLSYSIWEAIKYFDIIKTPSMAKYYEDLMVDIFPHHKYAKEIYWRKISRKSQKKALELLNEHKNNIQDKEK